MVVQPDTLAETRKVARSVQMDTTALTMNFQIVSNVLKIQHLTQQVQHSLIHAMHAKRKFLVMVYVKWFR